MASTAQHSASESASPRASTSRERHDEPVETKPGTDQLRQSLYGDETDDAAGHFPESNGDGGQPYGEETGDVKKGGGKRSSAATGSVKLDENGNPKKKRKQLV